MRINNSGANIDSKVVSLVWPLALAAPIRQSGASTAIFSAVDVWLVQQFPYLWTGTI